MLRKRYCRRGHDKLVVGLYPNTTNCKACGSRSTWTPEEVEQARAKDRARYQNDPEYRKHKNLNTYRWNNLSPKGIARNDRQFLRKEGIAYE